MPPCPRAGPARPARWDPGARGGARGTPIAGAGGGSSGWGSPSGGGGSSGGGLGDGERPGKRLARADLPLDGQGAGGRGAGRGAGAGTGPAVESGPKSF